MNDMDAKKIVDLTIDEIKELTFQLEIALQQLQLEFEQNEPSDSKILQEKTDFIKEIILKLNR